MCIQENVKLNLIPMKPYQKQYFGWGRNFYPKGNIFIGTLTDTVGNTCNFSIHKNTSNIFIIKCITVQILCIGTDRSQQTVQTKIRLLLKKQSDQGLHCLPFHQHLLDA